MTAPYVAPSPGDIVAVTGATGYVASHCIYQLLDKGYRVRGTVRSVDSPKNAMFDDFPNRANLTLVAGQLLEDGSYDDACAGAHYVMHVASPYVLDVKDPQRDLVDPAVRGTNNVLASVVKAGTVRRVVLTSSVAAITDSPENDHVYTEADWNTKSTLKRNPYYLSKKLAEEEAWATAKRDGIDLVVMNPFVIIGPAFNSTANPSNAIFSGIMNGEYPSLMDLNWGFVSVKTVARAHVLAMETATASGRYLLCGTSRHMNEVTALLKQNFPEYDKIPTKSLSCRGGTAIVKAASHFQPKQTGVYLRTNLGKKFTFDNSKSRTELGLVYADCDTTIVDSVKSSIRWAHLEDKRGDGAAARDAANVYRDSERVRVDADPDAPAAAAAAS